MGGSLFEMTKKDTTQFKRTLRYIFENYDAEQFDSCAALAQNRELAEEICSGTENAAAGFTREGLRSVLEIGGRYGRYTGMFARVSANVTVVEKNIENLTLIQLRNKAYSNITYLTSLPQDAGFDLIFLNGKENSLSDYGFSSESEAAAALFPLLSEDGVLYLLHSIGTEKPAFADEKREEAIAGIYAEQDSWYPYPNTDTAMLFLFNRRRAPTQRELYCYPYFNPPQEESPFTDEILEFRKKSGK